MQVAQLERESDEIVSLESRAELAENERDAALERLHISTPRPPLQIGDMWEMLGAEGCQKLEEAINDHRCGCHQKYKLAGVTASVDADENRASLVILLFG